MDRSKLLVVIGILLILGVVGFGLSTILGDDNEAQLAFQDALIAQETIVLISEIATEHAGDPSTRARAVSIASTTASDRAQLAPFYQNTYGELPVNTEIATITELESTSEGFSQKYRELVLRYLRISIDHLRSLEAQTGNQEFASTLDRAIANQQSHIDALTSS